MLGYFKQLSGFSLLLRLLLVVLILNEDRISLDKRVTLKRHVQNIFNLLGGELFFFLKAAGGYVRSFFFPFSIGDSVKGLVHRGSRLYH